MNQWGISESLASASQADCQEFHGTSCDCRSGCGIDTNNQGAILLGYICIFERNMRFYITIKYNSLATELGVKAEAPLL